MIPPLRSLLFSVMFYTWNFFLCLVCVVFLLLPRTYVLRLIYWYLGTLEWLERNILDLHYVVRGQNNIPTGPVLIAAKHQSAWETFKLPLLFPQGAIVLKQELLRIPIWGRFLSYVPLVALDRLAGVQALHHLLHQAKSFISQGYSLIIFPQGTRTAIGESRRYQSGIFFLYEKLCLPILPMALNSGLFWSKSWFGKYSGTIVIEFLPPIPPGKPRQEVRRFLEEQLETASERLVASVVQK